MAINICMNIYSIIQELDSDRSRLHKEAVLHREVDNDLLKLVFQYALDPYRQFYIRKIPKYNSPKSGQPVAHLYWALTELDRLSSRELTGNKAIDHLTYLLSSLSSDDAKIIEMVIGKDMKCGVSEATVNKIWPGLVEVFPCMTAAGFEQKHIDKMEFPVIVQEKLDGLRFTAIVKDGVVEYRARSGRLIFLNGELEKEFLLLADGQNVVFDGELIFAKPDWSGYLDRKTSNGIGLKAIKGTISIAETQQACVELWDIISHNSFIGGESTIHYERRLAQLCDRINNLQQDRVRIKLAKTDTAYSFDEIQQIYEAHRALGHEGVIVKDRYLTWISKRVDKQVKIKAEKVCELRVKDIQMGTGKYTGMLGAIICESDDGIIEVDVGSGFKDHERHLDYIGKIVSVKYNEKIVNKNGKHSLFLPIFIEVRVDKDRADRFNEIK